jgi:hypothetical protein
MDLTATASSATETRSGQVSSSETWTDRASNRRIFMSRLRTMLHFPIGRTALAICFASFLLLTDTAVAQVNQNTQGNCSPNFYGNNNMVVCPPASNPTRPGGVHGRWRLGEFIPTCEPGYGYSREHQKCIPAQYIGGVIPCSADDTSFVNGRYVPNCQ